MVWGGWVESWGAPCTKRVKQREDAQQGVESESCRAKKRNRGPDAEGKNGSGGRVGSSIR